MLKVSAQGSCRKQSEGVGRVGPRTKQDRPFGGIATPAAELDVDTRSVESLAESPKGHSGRRQGYPRRRKTASDEDAKTLRLEVRAKLGDVKAAWCSEVEDCVAGLDWSKESGTDATGKHSEPDKGSQEPLGSQDVGSSGKPGEPRDQEDQAWSYKRGRKDGEAPGPCERLHGQQTICAKEVPPHLSRGLRASASSRPSRVVGGAGQRSPRAKQEIEDEERAQPAIVVATRGWRVAHIGSAGPED